MEEYECLICGKKFSDQDELEQHEEEKASISSEVREAASSLGKLGGEAKLRKYGKIAYADMGKKSGESRRLKNKL